MMACYLARHLPIEKYKISINQTPLISHATLYGTAHADLKRFNKNIGLKELEFIQRTSACFKLSEQYVGFGPRPFHLPFADYGLPLDGVPLQRLLKVLGQDSTPEYMERYCLPVAAATAGRFLLPDSKGRPIVSDYGYGYHLCAQSYTDLLLEKAIEMGATHEDSPETADLIVNAVMPQIYQKNWSTSGNRVSYHTAECDPSLSSIAKFEKSASSLSLTYMTQSTSVSVSLKENTKNGIALPIGMQDSAWTDNILNIGPAAVGFNPILGFPLLSAQQDCERLVELFPPASGHKTRQSPEAKEYNRRWRSSCHRLHDFQSLLFGSSLSEEAQNKTSLFESNGHLDTLDDDDILLEQWVPMLLGIGLKSGRIDAIAASLNKNEMAKHLDEMEAFIQRTVSTMPALKDFIAKTCPAPQSSAA